MKKKKSSLPKQKPTLKVNKEWTPARKHSFIVSALRRGWSKFPAKWQVMKAASVGKKINEKSGRLAEHYTCAKCLKEFPAKDVSVDHIIGVVGKEGFTNWDDFINRLFCEKENLQILCTETCHHQKSQEERKERKEYEGISSL